MASPAPAAQDQDGELRASPPRLPRLQTGADTADSAVLVSPVEATPASAIPTSGPAATTTATAIRHRRTASDIKPTSPYARRMSLSSTPQSIRGDLPRDYAVLRYARAVASRPVLSIAIVLSVFTLSATAYASIHSLALNTSLFPNPPTSSTSFFARKDNPFNIYGVKLAWLHTSVIYLTHLLTSPSSPVSPGWLAGLWTYLLATTFWAVFTTWFFGRGIGDRIIELSGGKCVIALPSEWGLDRGRVEEMMRLIPESVGTELLATSMDAMAAAASSSASTGTFDNLYLSVPATLCTLHRPLTPKSHPDIFSIIKSLPFPASFIGESAKPLAIPRPRWYRGHDISGHIFILVLSTMLLTRRLVPTWKRWLGHARDGQRSIGADDRYTPLLKTVHVLATLAGTALIGLWLWMTLMTATYFHNPQEKLSGLALGLFASFILEILTPASSPSISPPSGSANQQPIYPHSKQSPNEDMGSDENRARREGIVDDGKKVDLQPAADITSAETGEDAVKSRAGRRGVGPVPAEGGRAGREKAE